MMSYGLVGLLVLPWIIYRRKTWWPQRQLVLMIALAGGLANVCFLSAIVRGDVVRVMLLFYLAPVWGVIGGRIFFGEPLTRLRVVGVATAVVGAVLLLAVLRALDAHVRVQVVPRLYELVQARGFELGRISVLEAGGGERTTSERFVKRTIDVGGAANSSDYFQLIGGILDAVLAAGK